MSAINRHITELERQLADALTEVVNKGIEVAAVRKIAADQLAEARAQIAAKDAALRLVDEVLTSHETRTETLHRMVLEVRDLIRPKLGPDSPAWMREAFEKLHAVHYGMGGDPLVMHVRAALTQPTPAQEDKP